MKRIQKAISVVVMVMLILSGVGIAVCYLSNRPKKALEKQVMAMTGINIDLSFEHAKAYCNILTRRDGCPQPSPTPRALGDKCPSRSVDATTDQEGDLAQIKDKLYLADCVHIEHKRRIIICNLG